MSNRAFQGQAICTVVILTSLILTILMAIFVAPAHLFGAGFSESACELITSDPGEVELVECGCGAESCRSFYPCLQISALSVEVSESGGDDSVRLTKKNIGILGYDADAVRAGCLVALPECSRSFNWNNETIFDFWAELRREVQEDLGGTFKCWSKGGRIFVKDPEASLVKGLAAVLSPGLLLLVSIIITGWLWPVCIENTLILIFFPCCWVAGDKCRDFECRDCFQRGTTSSGVVQEKRASHTTELTEREPVTVFTPPGKAEERGLCERESPSQSLQLPNQPRV